MPKREPLGRDIENVLKEMKERLQPGLQRVAAVCKRVSESSILALRSR